MSSISNFGIPGILCGVLHPKLNHQFRVLFFNAKGEPVAIDLSRQITSISLPSFTSVVHAGESSEGTVTYKLESGNCIYFNLEEDIGEVTNLALYELMVSGAFTMRIDLLDGNDTATSFYTIERAVVEQVSNTALNYGMYHRTASLRFPSYLATDLPDQVVELQKFLTGVTIDFNDAVPNNGKMVKSINIGYDQVTHTIYKRA